MNKESNAREIPLPELRPVGKMLTITIPGREPIKCEVADGAPIEIESEGWQDVEKMERTKNDLFHALDAFATAHGLENGEYLLKFILGNHEPPKS